MAFLRRAKHVLDMIRNRRQLELLYDDLMYSPPRDPQIIFGIHDHVKKVTGDYHVSGHVVAVFRTMWLGKLRYVVEISAEGGGWFCHIFAPNQLELIEKAKKPAPEITFSETAPPAAARVKNFL